MASCLRGALPPVDLRAVCLVRAIATVCECGGSCGGSRKFLQEKQKFWSFEQMGGDEETRASLVARQSLSLNVKSTSSKYDTLITPSLPSHWLMCHKPIRSQECLVQNAKIDNTLCQPRVAIKGLSSVNFTKIFNFFKALQQASSSQQTKQPCLDAAREVRASERAVPSATARSSVTTSRVSIDHSLPLYYCTATVERCPRSEQSILHGFLVA